MGTRLIKLCEKYATNFAAEKQYQARVRSILQSSIVSQLIACPCTVARRAPIKALRITPLILFFVLGSAI